jgi:sugar lactone lactonase YvrE
MLMVAALAAPALGAQVTPVNSLPNPYQTVSGWAKMPEGRTWGSTSAVAIDRDGSSIWVAERCGANACVGSNLDPVLHFDASGNLIGHFGAGKILSPHGIFIDNDKNVWVVDCACTLGRGGAAPTGAGHQIYKFSPDGKLLMTLGTPGGGRDSLYFFQPNAVYVAPDGSVFVSEGHASNANATARVYKFSKDGKLLRTFGHWGKGNGPDEFDQPHALAMDSKGRLYVGDRGNNRIKIFDQDFKLLDTWYQFSRPSGIFIDASDNIYVADSESGSVNPAHGDWTRGIRVGSAKDGSVKYFIPDPETAPPSTSSAEGVAVDKNGVIYGAEVGGKRLQRYVKP